MDIEKRIIAFAALGKILRDSNAGSMSKILSAAMKPAAAHNAWFTNENILLSINSLGKMLDERKLKNWIEDYPHIKNQRPEVKNVGAIMAGNIPLVGFHDFLCILMSGNRFIGKLSSDDAYLLPAVAKTLIEIEPEFKELIHFIDKPFQKSAGISAYIATGSNNSARYFEYYFGKYPHIIRKSRNAVALLDGTESASDLKNLGKDIFQYFGMGCRNVSKIFIPLDYNLDHFFASIVDFGDIINHNKYANNYHYYRTIYLMNQEKFLDNNFLLVKESREIASPVSTLYFERYNIQEELIKVMEEKKDRIQCIAGNILPHSSSPKCIPFGNTQSPELQDYADGIDTMNFLLTL